MLTESVSLSFLFEFTVTAEHIQSEQLRQDIMHKYDAMNDELLDKMRQNMDQKQLRLDESLPIFDDDDLSPYQGSNLKLFTKITLQWNAQSLGIDVGDFQENRAMKRIVFVMDLFDEYFLKHFCRKTDAKDNAGDMHFIDIFTHCLSGYNGMALLNDLEYIRDHKEHIPVMDCQYGNDSSECIGETIRQYRGSESNNMVQGVFEEYMDELSLRERHLIKTASRIHSFVCHENHCDEKEEDGGSLKQNMRTERKEEMSNKFVNEIGSNPSAEKVEAKRMDDLAARLEEMGLSISDCTRFMDELFAQQYDSDAVVDDLVDDENDPFNLYKDTNLFPLLDFNPFLTKNIRKHFGVFGNDDDRLPIFSFGKDRLYQWIAYKDEDGYVGNPRYGSLKDECLNNRIHKMTMRQFSEMLCSAFMFRDCSKGRAFRALNGGSWNVSYEVPVDSPLSVCHIFVLLMYCNLTDLQYKYKKIGCRERDSEQTLEELVDWNKEIWHWHRYFYIAVYMFGDRAVPSHVFYTGLSTKLSFPSFAPIFNAPFSTTTSINIATGFCGVDGVILMMIPSPSSRDRFFDVQWLSAFAHEKERVFVRADQMRIADIKYHARGTWQNSQRYLRAFNLFSALFSGQVISPILRVKTKKNQKPSKVLLDLIRIYKINNNIEITLSNNETQSKNTITIYIQQLFYQLLDQFKQKHGGKYLIKSEYDLLDKSLQNELDVISSDELQAEISDIQLSPRMRSLFRKEDIVIMQEYVWVVEEEQVKELRDAKAKNRKSIYSDMQYFNLSSQQRVAFQYETYVNSSGTDWGGFGILVKETPVAVDSRMSFIVDELNVFYSKVKNNLRDGGRSTNWMFRRHMLDKVDTFAVKFAIHFVPSE